MTAVRWTSAIVWCLVLLAVFAPVEAEEELVYTARPGDTLEKVVKEYGVQSVGVDELRRFNGLGNVREIPPGTKIRFRLGWLKIKPLEAKAQAVSGEVTVIRANGTEGKPVTEGSEFKPGDVLMTGKNSSVMLKFGDGSRLLLQGESSLTFEVLEKYGDPDVPNIRLRLHRGRVDTQVAPNESPDRRFEIRTPAGSAGARGTRFRVGADDDTRQLFTEVTHGVVAVAGGGEELSVEERFGTVVEAGRPPIPPLPLLPAPDLSGVQPLYRRLPLAIRWKGPAGAEGYRVLLAPSTGGGAVRIDERVSVPEAILDDLEDGDYRLIVRAIDSHGLEGLDAEGTFTLDAHPLPPRLVAPAKGERLYHGRPRFEWQPSGEAVDYRFQLAFANDFRSPLLDMRIGKGVGFEPKAPLSPGRYYWRIASIDGKGEEGAFGEVFDFEVARLPVPPRGLVIQKTKKKLILRWQPAGAGSRYQLQLASDRAFSRLVIERETGKTELVLPRPQQKVYLRMRTLDEAGYPGEYSEPIEIVPPLENLLPLFILGTAGLVFLL